MNYHKKMSKDWNPAVAETKYIVDVLLHLSRQCVQNASMNTLKPCPAGERGAMEVFAFAPAHCASFRTD